MHPKRKTIEQKYPHIDWSVLGPTGAGFHIGTVPVSCVLLTSTDRYLDGTTIKWDVLTGRADVHRKFQEPVKLYAIFSAEKLLLKLNELT